MMVKIMKKGYILGIILQLIFVLIIIVSCKGKYNGIIEVENVYSKEETEIYNIFINNLYTEVDSFEEYIVKNKPYKIKHWPFHILILENEKCYGTEEWHEAMTPFGGGIIIFGEKITILSEKYYYGEIRHNLIIIDENDNFVVNGEIVANNTKIRIIEDKVEIQYYNSNNELVKQLFEIEDLL
jgi:hypothetical protein